MIKIGFVGAYDKTDIILYIAKIISLIGKKVLVIDSTINQKAKYVVPVINPTKSYITEFEGMDIAVGFNNLQQIQEYLGTEDKKIDYVMKNIEGKDYLQYEWIELDRIEEYTLLPKVLKEVLKENKFPIHKINDELK